MKNMSILMILIPLLHIATEGLIWKRSGSLGSKRIIQSRWKKKILDILLSGYNDGRKKTLFCVAVNLLNLQELKEALREIESRPDMEILTLKEKSTFAAGVLSEIASRRKVDLKLHRKK